MKSVARKFNIAAANPLLAEKLSTPSGQHSQHMNYAHRSQVAEPAMKVDKGKFSIGKKDIIFVN